MILERIIDGTAYECSTTIRNLRGLPVKSWSRLSPGDAGYVPCPAGFYRFRLSGAESLDFVDRLSSLPLFSDVSVVVDGITENLNVIPGFSITLNHRAQVHDDFIVFVDLPEYSAGSRCFGTSHYSPVFPGYPTRSRRFRITNDSGNNITEAEFVITNSARLSNSVSPVRPVLSLRQTGTLNPTPGTYEFTFTNRTAGTPDTVAVVVSDHSIDLVEVATGTAIYGGLTAKLDGTTEYRFLDGSLLQSVSFILSPDLSETDTATVVVDVCDLSIETSLDGSVFQAGNAPLTLGTAGLLADGEAADVRIRFNPVSNGIGTVQFSARFAGTNEDDSAVWAEWHGAVPFASVSDSLMVSIGLVQPAYDRPRFSYVGGEYVLDDSGDYVEEENTPGSFILRTLDARQGKYSDIMTILESCGVYYRNED